MVSVQTNVQKFASTTPFISHEIVNSALYSFCEADKGILADGLYTYFSQCRQLRLWKELVIFGCNSNLQTDQIWDLFILLAKYPIFHAKTNNGSPLIQLFVRTVKQRFAIEKHNAVINDNITLIRN